MARTRRHQLILLCIALFGVLLVPAGASAARCDPHAMLDAAYNNRQISGYTTACYERTLADLSSDVDSYAPNVRVNLLYAMRLDSAITARSHNRNARLLASGPAEPAAAVAVRGPVTNMLADLGPSHVDQVPTPVYALGGAAVLLLLAGLATSLARVRTRRLSR